MTQIKKTYKVQYHGFTTALIILVLMFFVACKKDSSNYSNSYSNSLIQSFDGQSQKQLLESIHRFIVGGHKEALYSLLQQYPKLIDQKNKYGYPPLTTAAATNSKEIALWLLSKNAKIEKMGDKGNTALHLAAMKGHFEMIKLLLQHGAVVDKKNIEHQTPLMLACLLSVVESVDVLMSNGADPSISDNKKWTSVDYAISKGNGDIIRKLYEYTNKDIFNGNQWGVTTPLHLAIENRYTDVLDFYFAEYGKQRDANKAPIKIHVFDKNNRNLLHAAIESKSKPTLNKLLDAYTTYDLNEAMLQQDNNGQNPIHLVAGQHNDNILVHLLKIVVKSKEDKYIHSFICSLNQPDQFGLSPLFYLLLNDHVETAVNLMKASQDKLKLVEDLYQRSFFSFLLDKDKNDRIRELLKFLDKKSIKKMLSLKDSNHRNALHWAVIKADYFLIEQFFNLSPQLATVRDKFGALPADLSNDSAIRRLLKNGMATPSGISQPAKLHKKKSAKLHKKKSRN